MKLFNVLKDFKGSQYGYSEPVYFKEGDVAELTDYLADVALQYGYVEEVSDFEPAETKVITPAETKIKKGKNNA